jgi:hypothetical protein
VLRDFLRGVFQKNEMPLVARDHGALGQSARRLPDRLSGYRHFLWLRFAQAGLGELSAAGIIGAFALPLAFMQTEAALGLPQMRQSRMLFTFRPIFRMRPFSTTGTWAAF